MIFDEETDPKSKKPKPCALDNLSVPELKAYLAALDGEKARVEAEVRKKEGYKSAADSFFKS